MSNDGNEDTSGRKTGNARQRHGVPRCEFCARRDAAQSPHHSIDYAVVISGEIDMGLDDGVNVHLKAGDVLVQRGTIHNWVNNGTAPCVIAFVLIASKPVTAGGKVLNAAG